MQHTSKAPKCNRESENKSIWLVYSIFIASIKSFVVTYSRVKVLQPMLN